MTGRLLLDCRALQPGFKAHLTRGIGRYAKNLLAAMAQQLGDRPVCALAQGNLPDPQLPAAWPLVKSPYAPDWLPIGKRLISHHMVVPATVSKHAPALTHYLAHIDAPARPPAPAVITVHDLIAQKMAALYRADKSDARFRLERWLETRCLFGAARIIAVSQCTKADLMELYGLPPDKITVVAEAADPDLAPVTDPEAVRQTLARHGLDHGRPFFLYVGGIDQRKGLPTLLAALAGLKERGLPHRLALAGKIKDDGQYPAFRATVEGHGLGSAVLELGFVPDADLPALFGAAAAFVFPSLYEGFGLPPLEAMACGAAVVAARAAAVPEVVGEAGLLAPPGDPASLCRALAAILEQPELAPSLRQKGARRAAMFTWEKAAQETLRVYAEVGAVQAS